MATAVTLTAGMADDLERNPGAKYPIGEQNPYAGMLQALLTLAPGGDYAAYCGQATVDGTDVSAGKKSITFTNERASANYAVLAWMESTSGDLTQCQPDLSSRATTGFDIKVEEEGTLQWFAFGYRS